MTRKKITKFVYNRLKAKCKALTEKQTKMVVEFFILAIEDLLLTQKKIVLFNLFTIHVVKRKGKKYIDLNTKQEKHYPNHFTLKITPSNYIFQKLNIKKK